MKRWIPFIAVGLAVVLVVGGVVALVDSGGPTAVTVGSTSISQQSVDEELTAIADNDTLQNLIAQSQQQNQQVQPLSITDGSVTSETGSGWIGLLVATTIAEHEVAKKKLEATDADRKQGRSLAAQSVGGDAVFNTMPEWFQDRLGKRWTAVATLQREVLANPTPALLDAVSQVCPSNRYVSHILVKTEADAQAIKRALDAGGDFAKLAKANSIDGSATDGGQLGCIDGQNFVEPFATVASTQPVGVVSDPVQTEFGYHLILATDQPPPSVLEQAAIPEILGHARGKRVHVDPRYGIWDRKNGSVAAPRTPATAPATAPPPAAVPSG